MQICEVKSFFNDHLNKKRDRFVWTHIVPFIERDRHGRHHRSKMIAYAVISVTNQTANKYGTTRVNMSRETHKVVMMRSKIITANLLKIVGLLVEHITSIAKPKASLERYLSLKKTPWKVSSSKPVISPSLSSFFSFGSMLRSNSISNWSIGYWWSTVESYVGNSSGHCRRRNTTGTMKCIESSNCLYFINLINGGVSFWPVSQHQFKKVLLKKSRASCSKNSLIPINFS